MTLLYTFLTLLMARTQMPSCCPVIELRSYTLHPGARETFISLFEREFVETQEAVGMQLISQFRDIDRPDTFTWLRGFPDLPSRKASLGTFYGRPVWAAHKDSANGGIVSSDNVRLIRPALEGSGFHLGERAGPGATAIPSELLVVIIYTLAAPASQGFAQAFDRIIKPELVASGASPLAVLETEPGANTFPRLPVREGEHAFIWLTRFADVAAYDRWKAGLEADKRWRDVAVPVLDQYRRLPAEVFPVEIMRLVPTARSRSILPP